MNEENSNKWGDLGNGYYKNPVINADYSDPDVIRVGKDFYMVCSEFHYMGIPVLHSRDLVNWEIISRVYDEFLFHENYSSVCAYGKGSWAPSIRYHNGLFYIYFCTPDEGLYMTTAQNPAGPWHPLHEVKRVENWEDPCPFWDEDGTAYLGHSTWGAGPIIIHKMSNDGKTLLDDGVVVYVGKVAEGTKIYKRNDYYYLSIPEGGVEKGWQTVLRSKSIYGPFEKRIVLQTGNTAVNGPHQGAIAELENGESWFMHFQSVEALGRVCHLQPVRWIDDWPIIGLEGEPVSVYKKPGTELMSRRLPQTSDDFSNGLGLQWQWNHNPVHEKWRIENNKLVLTAMKAEGLFRAKNTLTQKLMGIKGEISVALYVGGMAEGQQAGLAFLGGMKENYIEAVKDLYGVRIKAVANGVVSHGGYVDSDEITFKAYVNLHEETWFCFKAETAVRLGGSCKLADGFWKGARPALFSYNTNRDGGEAVFSKFIYTVLD